MYIDPHLQRVHRGRRKGWDFCRGSRPARNDASAGTGEYESFRHSHRPLFRKMYERIFVNGMITASEVAHLLSCFSFFHSWCACANCIQADVGSRCVVHVKPSIRTSHSIDIIGTLLKYTSRCIYRLMHETRLLSHPPLHAHEHI